MSLLIVFLWILLAISLIEVICGVVKKSGVLITVGIIVAVMCALGIILAMNYAESIIITGDGILV